MAVPSLQRNTIHAELSSPCVEIQRLYDTEQTLIILTVPQFSPTSSALFNALGSCLPAPTTTVLTGTQSYPIPLPVDRGLYPAGPSTQNNGWTLPDCQYLFIYLIQDFAQGILYTSDEIS